MNPFLPQDSEYTSEPDKHPDLEITENLLIIMSDDCTPLSLLVQSDKPT
jgi:hypothetical protein